MHPTRESWVLAEGRWWEKGETEGEVSLLHGTTICGESLHGEIIWKRKKKKNSKHDSSKHTKKEAVCFAEFHQEGETWWRCGRIAKVGFINQSGSTQKVPLCPVWSSSLCDTVMWENILSIRTWDVFFVCFCCRCFISQKEKSLKKLKYSGNSLRAFVATVRFHRSFRRMICCIYIIQKELNKWWHQHLKY